MNNTLEQYSYFQGPVCNFVEFLKTKFFWIERYDGLERIIFLDTIFWMNFRRNNDQFLSKNEDSNRMNFIR